MVKRVCRALCAALPLLATLAVPAAAQVSNCQAIASLQAPKIWYASAGAKPATVQPGAVQPGGAVQPANAQYEVSITYVGHASFRIVAPDGTTIVTDFTGIAGSGGLPDVVTMNHAHTSHWTPNPDPAIAHVLRGWSDTEDRAEHFLKVGEVLIRNVPTDIRNYYGVEENGNSVFIFEVAGLCIGHLGHLHQPLSDQQIAEIGRLDIVFVPIDGTYTMNQGTMMEVVTRLRASLAIPMHWFSEYTLADFVSRTRADGLEVAVASQPDFTVSLNSLPDRPTLKVLPRELPF